MLNFKKNFGVAKSYKYAHFWWYQHFNVSNHKSQPTIKYEGLKLIIGMPNGFPIIKCLLYFLPIFNHVNNNFFVLHVQAVKEQMDD